MSDDNLSVKMGLVSLIIHGAFRHSRSSIVETVFPISAKFWSIFLNNCPF